MRTIVMSIQPKWANLIRSGTKTVELRKQFPCHLSGSTAYLYESSPNCKLSSVMRIGSINELSIEELWQLHGKLSCVSKEHFDAYFDGRDTGFGLQIAKYAPLIKTWELSSLRRLFDFTPPQSWAYASPKLVAAIGIVI